jgi:hypothetical protein
MPVEASIVVEFADDVSEESQNVSIELDDTHANNLDADGEAKSSFLPTDSPVFLIHHDADVRVTGVKCTDSSVVQLDSNVDRIRVESQLFPLLASKVTLPYFNVNSISTTWYGNEASLSVDDSKVSSSSGDFPCYGDISFSVRFNEQWQLNAPNMSLAEDETYTIYVVIYMEAVT